MQIKTILAPMHNIEEARRLVGPAAELARRHGAHLIGLHVAEAIVIYSDYAMLPAGPDVGRLSAAQEERAEEIGAYFNKATEGDTFASEWRFIQAQGATASDWIIEQARVADLVVMAQQNPTADSAANQVTLERTIRKSGRPVLVMPYAGTFEKFGRKALVGWSATREAARAAHDAIPLIDEGGSALILTAHHAHEKSLPAQSAKELAAVYDRHGVSASTVERIVEGITVGDILLNEAFERDCDLIVTGAFGHSRLYDFVIGATTTRLLESMTVPVLFSS